MLKLTPLGETVAGKELIQIEKLQGLQEGKLIGQIQMIQNLIKQEITSEAELLQKNKKE